MLWLAEVDAVIAEVDRIASQQQDDALAVRLRGELASGRSLAERKSVASKAFHFAPSPAGAELGQRAIAAARH